MERLSDKAKRTICNLQDLNNSSNKTLDEAENLCQQVYHREGETLNTISNITNRSNSTISDMLEYEKKHKIEMDKLNKQLSQLQKERKKSTKSNPKPKRCSCRKK
jgi:hypothetical protein